MSFELKSKVRVVPGEFKHLWHWYEKKGEIVGFGTTPFPHHHVRFPNGEVLIIPESMLRLLPPVAS